MMESLLIMNLSFYSLVFLNSVVDSLEMHELMTDQQYQVSFGGSRDNVPEYDVIRISHSINIREIKGENPVSFNAFGRDVKLNLQPVAHAQIPVWIANEEIVQSTLNGTHKVSYRRVNPFIMSDAVKFYEDPHNMAGMAIEADDNGHLFFLGSVGRDFTIRSVAPVVINEWRRLFNKKQGPPSPGSSEFSTISDYHIIVKNNKSDQQFENIGDKSASSERLKKIFPRLLIFTHYQETYTTEFELRFYKFLIYLVAFWHSVNLRFRKFSDPAIMLRITGIVVGMNKRAAPYLYGNKVTNQPCISDEDALKDFGRWVRDNSPTLRKSWDIAIILTDAALCLSGDEFLYSKGVSWTKAQCNITDPYIIMTAIVKDDLKFDGIDAATHELGHLLGAPHDGERGAKSCANDTKIMQTIESPSTNLLEWSNCSIKAISRHIKKMYPHCWRKIVNENPNLIGSEIPEILPGHLISPNDQCRNLDWHSACTVDENTCESLGCYNLDIFGGSWLSRCYNTGVPLDGTPCGNGKQCKAGKCVD